MAKEKKPTTVEAPERKANGKVVNPRSIEWPADTFGFTTCLKKEGVRAVGRIKGDKEKLEVLNGVLRCIAQHAAAKIEDQVKDAEQMQAAAKNRADAAYVRSIQDQEREVARLEALTASAKATLEAKKMEKAEKDAE